MSRRTKVTGTRSFTLWLLILIAVVLVVGVAAGGLFIIPQIQSQQDLEKHYQAGVAFQNVSDWDKAAGEYEQVIVIDANYQDVQMRLAEVRAKLAEREATATAMAVAQAEQAQMEAQATATAQAQATAEAQVHAKTTATAQAEQAQAEAQATATAQAQATADAQADAAATAAAAPTATAEALETHYQKGLGYMNIGRWEEARAELEQVFEKDPNYKEVQAKLTEVEAEVAKLTPTATPTPVETPTPTVTATPEIKSPSIEWLGFVGDQVSPSFSGTGPDGKADGVFELILPDVGRTVAHILLATPDGHHHWDTDGGTSWVLGVIEQDSGRRLHKLGAPMDYQIERTTKLHLYASVSTSGFRPGQEYKVTVRFADGYLVELSIRIP